MKDKIVSKVNLQLSEIYNNRNLTEQDRGTMGEEVIADLVKYWSSRFEGSILKSSFMFEQSPNLPTLNSLEEKPVTEIDLLLVTPYVVFVIEVKTVYGFMRIYKDHNIEIIRKGKFTENYESKNYLRQNVMHARHLYYHLHTLLPEGNPIYIKPLIVMTGKMKFEDLRDPIYKAKYPIININKLIPTLIKYNQPFNYLLDMKKINRRLDRIQVHDKQRLLNSQTFKN